MQINITINVQRNQLAQTLDDGPGNVAFCSASPLIRAVCITVAKRMGCLVGLGGNTVHILTVAYRVGIGPTLVAYPSPPKSPD